MANLPRLPGIPSISPVKDQTIAAILRPMKESLEIISATITGDQLPNTSVISGGTSTAGTTTGAYDPTTDYTPPMIPTGFSVAGAFANIILTWDIPTYINHAYTEIWRSSTNVLGAAELIGFCPGAVYSDSVGNSSNYYYWIRFVSQADVAGPYNASSGTLGTTATDPSYVLGILTNQITTSQLAAALNTRIDLIDAPTSTTGSVNARINVVQSQVNDLLSIPAYVSTTTYTAGQQATYSGSLYQAITTTTGNPPTNTTYWTKIGDYTSLGDAVAANTVSISNLGTDLGTEVTARSALASQMRGSYTGTDITAISSGLLYEERTARASADSAMATQISSLISSVATNSAAILSESNTRASADSAMASSITTLSTTVSGNTTSISTNTTSINGIRAMYTVKIDNNGKLSGFGLSSDIIDSGTSTSKFLISVDQFAVIAPGATVGTPGSVPFAVLTTAQTINGVSFPAGVYIDGGSIVNASITNAKIGALAVDTANIANAAVTNAKIGSVDATKITTGYLSADRIQAGSVSADKIDSRGLTIKAADGTTILSAGSSLATSSFAGDVTGSVSGTAASTLVSTANTAQSTATAAVAAAATAQTTADSKLAKTGAQILTGPVTLNAASAITVGTPALDNVAGHNGFYIGNTGVVGTKDGKATFTLDNSGNASFSGELTVGSSPAISGTTMTGSGAHLYTDGRFAMGSSTANMVFDGTKISLNGLYDSVSSTVSTVDLSPTNPAVNTAHNPVTVFTFTVAKTGVVNITGNGVLQLGCTTGYSVGGAQFVLQHNIVPAGGGAGVVAESSLIISPFGVIYGSLTSINVPFSFSSYVNLNAGTYNLQVVNGGYLLKNNTTGASVLPPDYLAYVSATYYSYQAKI